MATKKRPAPSLANRKSPAGKTEPLIINFLRAMRDGDPRAKLPTSFQLVTKARAGDADAARTILIRCYTAFLHCPNPGWQQGLESDFAIYLSEAIEAILDGADANKALGTKKSKGRPTEDATGEKREAIAAAVVLLTRLGYEQRAIVDWLDANSIGKRTIQRAICENPWANDPATSDGFLKAVMRPIAPLITRFIDAKRKR